MTHPTQAWQRKTNGEHRAPAAITIVVLIALQIWISRALGIYPGWILAAIEGLLLLVLLLTNPGRLNREHMVIRQLGLGLVTAASAANALAGGMLIYQIVTKHANLSVMTPAPDRHVLEVVRELRIPGGETLYDREVRLALLQRQRS